VFALLGLPDLVNAAQITSPDGGFSVTYPDSWNANIVDRAVTLRNDTRGTPEGAFVPPGGAEIIVTVFPPYDSPYFKQGRDDESNLLDLAGGGAIVSRTTAASGRPAKLTSVKADLNLRTSRIVHHIGERTFLLMLWCDADDPHAEAYDAVMDAVSASIAVVPGTPLPATPTP
jgi:hypothetical protein